MSVQAMRVVVWSLLLALTCCNRDRSETVAAQGSASAVAPSMCAEHGVPEALCTKCNPALANVFKAKGDWCEEHNRADSQCFVCHPEKAEEFAALYRAQENADPPAMAD